MRIWNFYSKKLLNNLDLRIDICGISLWINNFLFVGTDDNKIKLISKKYYFSEIFI